MRNFVLIFTGIFFCVGVSWTVLVLENHKLLGGIVPINDEGAESGEAIVGTTLYPIKSPGLANRGKEIYISLGCASCHTQQVGHRGFGEDQEKGWGDRASYPRDYIRQERVLLGSSRIGPDLANAGMKERDEAWYLSHLYNPRAENPDSRMPSYKFLFSEQKINSRLGASKDALDLQGGCKPPEGYEVVPADDGRALELVAYIMNLKQDFDLPEAKAGTQSTAASGAAAGGGEALSLADLGKKTYQAKCMMCHQATGLGMAASFPPLVGSQWVLADKNLSINILLSGISGPIEVNGQEYNSSMPAGGGTPLSDNEIAAVLTYIRSQWGNSAGEVTPEEVAAVRSDKGVKSAPWTAAELLELYPLK